MGNPTVRSILDDGKGRQFTSELHGVESVALKQKENFQEVREPGDYAWETWAESFDMLVLVCPFCGFEAPMPWLIKVDCKDPLDIVPELYCKNCVTFFYIIKGVAYKSWLPLENLKKALEEKHGNDFK